MRAALAHGAAALLFQSTRPRDLLYRHTITWGTIAPIPIAQVRREDGLRLARLLDSGKPLQLRLDLQNNVGGPWQPSNVVAEIKGSAHPEEIVLLGAHLDSWDLGTGALDNGVNCAWSSRWRGRSPPARGPERTIRFVLFTSEEIGPARLAADTCAPIAARCPTTSPPSSTTSGTARSWATTPTAARSSTRR